MVNPIEGKQSLPLSGQTVFRTKAPTNKKLAEKIPSMCWDYSKPMRLFPDGDRRAFIEKSPQKISGNYTPLNPAGEPLRLNSTTGAIKKPSGQLFLQGQGHSKKALKRGK